MINYQHGKRTIACDDCGEEYSRHGKRMVYEPDDFDIMISDIKEDGWLIDKIVAMPGRTPEWTHTCPDCQ
jgi:hypothetical protein